MAAAVVLCLLVLPVCAGIGSAAISPRDVLSILLYKLTGRGADSVDPSLVSIFWEIRLPRVLTSFLAGGALSLSGAVMQSVLQNPLASSYTLGVSSGASLGAAIVIVSGITVPALGAFLLPLSGFAFAALTVLVVLGVSSRISRSMGTHTVILMGMAVSLFVNAMLTLVSTFAGEHAQQLILWQMGSFSGKRWYHVGILLPISLAGLLVLMTRARDLDILSFGDEQALSLGVDVKRAKRLALVLSSFLTGCTVCFTGTIGFVDLIAPHAVRKLFGSSMRRVLPMSFLLGGAFMTLCDTAARTILSPRELPVGAVTALLGTPFFIFLYARGSRAEGGI